MDTDNTFDEEKVMLMEIADKVIVITKQDQKSLYATNIFVSNININKDKKYVFVCNDYIEDNDDFSKSEMELRFNIDEYIEHVTDKISQKNNIFANSDKLQKITFLLM